MIHNQNVSTKKHKMEAPKQKIKCECGTLITRNYMAKHKKTTKHLLMAKIIKYEFIDSDAEESCESEAPEAK